MSYQRPIGTVEDYTDAFLGTLWVFLFMAFWVIAAVAGYLWVAATAYGLTQLFKWFDRIKNG